MKHPLGLYLLSLFEAFERFGYYLILVLFTFYLTEVIKMNNGDALSLYGTFIGLVYLMPLIGGKISDIIGHKTSVIIGSILMATGYYIIGTKDMLVLYAAIGLISVGTGFFKPAMSAMVSSIYPAKDPRRDGAFNIFYMFVNIGAFFSPFVGAYVKTNYGWAQAFACASYVLAAGTVFFLISSRWIVTVASTIAKEVVLPEVQRIRDKTFYFMCAIVIIFWIAFHQNGSTLPLWARDNTDRTFGGLFSTPIDPVYYGALNSIFIIWFTPIVVKFFSFLRTRGLEPSTPMKIGYGMVLTAISFGILSIAGLTGKVTSSWFFIFSTLAVTLGELCLSPMGLSMATKLSRPEKIGFTLGIWYLSTSIGNKLSGEIGIYWDRWSHTKFFGYLAIASLLAGVIVFLNRNWLNAAMPKDIDNTASDSLVPPNIIDMHQSSRTALLRILESDSMSTEDKLAKIHEMLDYKPR